MPWPFAAYRAARRAEGQRRRGDVHGAVKTYLELLANEGGRNARALVGLGHCYSKLGKYVAAVTCMEKAKDVKRENEDEFNVFDHLYHYTLAELYDKVGRSKECVKHYEEGLRLEHVPSDRTVSYPHLFYTLARHCKDIGDSEKAVTYFRRIQQPQVLGMSEADLLCELEDVLQDLGRVDEANECMRQAAGMRVLRPANLARIAWFHFNDKVKEAGGDEPDMQVVKDTVSALRQAIEKEPDNYKFWYQLGRVLFAAGIFPACEDALMNALKHNRHDYATWNLLGDLYSRTGRDDDAFAAMQRATELGSGDDAATCRSMMVMAKMLEASGNRFEAYRMYDRAANTNGGGDDVGAARAKVNRILHESALRLQKSFRGFCARKKINSVSARVFIRSYGARVPLRNFNADNLQVGGLYKSAFTTRT